MITCRVTILGCWFAVLSCGEVAAQPDTSQIGAEPSGDTRTGAEEAGSRTEVRSPEYWAGQLSSDHYLRRETAQQRLIESGDGAIGALESVLESSDLETTELAIRALGEIALAQRPDDDSGAWAALDRVSTQRAGSKASRAKLMINDVNEYRSEQAKIAIAASGIFIGTDDFVVQAIAESHLIIQIDDSWRGDLKALDWLRWIRDIRFARVVGSAINPEVLARLVRMPDLKTISLMDGKIDAAGITMLNEMRSIHTLEFRYVPLDDKLADAIQKLPMRSALSLIGTDLGRVKVDSMREALPGLKIEYKQGGYLGVSGGDGQAFCQINSVLPGSAAEKAGLQAHDVILQIGETPIRQFADLQNKIAEYSEGDSLSIQFKRGLQQIETTVVLGKQTE